MLAPKTLEDYCLEYKNAKNIICGFKYGSIKEVNDSFITDKCNIYFKNVVKVNPESNNIPLSVEGDLAGKVFVELEYETSFSHSQGKLFPIELFNLSIHPEDEGIAGQAEKAVCFPLNNRLVEFIFVNHEQINNVLKQSVEYRSWVALHFDIFPTVINLTTNGPIRPENFYIPRIDA